MKRIIAGVVVVGLLAVTLAATKPAEAGSRYYGGGHGGGYGGGPWAGFAVGAITGLVVGGIFAPRVYAAPPVVYQPAPVYVAPAPPVVYQPAYQPATAYAVPGPACSDSWVETYWNGYGWVQGYWQRTCR